MKNWKVLLAIFSVLIILVACNFNQKSSLDNTVSSSSSTQVATNSTSSDSAEQQLKKQKITEATKLVENAEKDQNRDNYNKANDLVSKLPTNEPYLKNRLSQVLEAIENTEKAEVERIATELAEQQAIEVEQNRIAAEQQALQDQYNQQAQAPVDYAYDVTNGQAIERPNDQASVNARSQWQNDQLEWAKQNRY